MRIAVWHNLSTGGGKRSLYTHVRGLVERGHRVSAWTLSERRDYLPLSGLVDERVVPMSWRARTPGSPAGRVYGVYHNRVARLRAMIEACRRSAEEIDAGGFDVVLVHGDEVYGMPFVPRHLRTPGAVYLHEPFRPFYEARPVLPWVGDVTAGGSVLRRAALAAADAARLLTDRAQAREEHRNALAAGTILVNSFYSRESVIRTYGRDARVCYLGVDTSLFRPTGRPRERFVAGLGAVDAAKGVELAIRAVSLLPAPRPPLVWVADRATPAYRARMEEVSAELDVDFRVRLRVTDGELVEVLNTAAALVYTSELEPFGLAPLEAAACGTPVVAVAEGGVRETIRDGMNGFAVQRSADEVAAGLRALLDDPALARRLGEAGARNVEEEWSTARGIDRLEAELVRVAAGGPGAAGKGVRGEAE
ncbi:MAG TPA: glycosyltransferase family 4 protein [Longimicrobium sp.]|jgi:glycosyltransferase involved in cell wall biosynthesis|uniref:glycosyltransferase family 4 protein n=1 Tax=Longimicrobium sp. TaxID=2029185 RepID=UPI002EDAECF1